MSPAEQKQRRVDPDLMNEIWDLSNSSYSRIATEIRREIEMEEARRVAEKAARSLLRRILGVVGEK